MVGPTGNLERLKLYLFSLIFSDPSSEPPQPSTSQFRSREDQSKERKAFLKKHDITGVQFTIYAMLKNSSMRSIRIEFYGKNANRTQKRSILLKETEEFLKLLDEGKMDVINKIKVIFQNESKDCKDFDWPEMIDWNGLRKQILDVMKSEGHSKEEVEKIVWNQKFDEDLKEDSEANKPLRRILKLICFWLNFTKVERGWLMKKKKVSGED